MPSPELTVAIPAHGGVDVGTMNVATTRPFEMSGHPTGRLDFTLPDVLAQAGARVKDGGGTLECLACHSAATPEFAPITLSASGPDGLCLACHPGQQNVFGTLHDIRSEPRSSGTCRTCHPVHGPSRDAVSAPGDPEGRCTSCHQTHGWGQAKSVSAFPHPETACSECHDPHESRFGKFLVESAGKLCTECHADQAAVIGGPHDPSRHPDAWPDVTAARRGICLACHVPHSNVATSLLRFPPSQPSAPDDAACLACHAEAGWGAGSDIAILHPREIRPDQDKVDPAHVPSDTAGHQRMTCRTCHDPHSGAKPGYLTRGSPDEPAGLCLGCHEQKKYIKHTGHSTESLLELDFDAEGCRPCHAMHARRDRAWGQMLSPRFLEMVNGSHADMPGDGALCMVCHRPEGAAPVPAVAAHPSVPIHNTIAPEAPGYLPLFDAAGHVSADGQVTCRTCHLSHGRLDLLELAESNTTMSDQDRRAMRLNVRSFVAPNICTQCHGHEARLRFLIFHDTAERAKLPPKK
jgi:predicted CXXCH cytochrome family protein